MIVSNFFMTGVPGTGKTTLIRRIFLDLVRYGPTGFYAQELREEGVGKYRVGGCGSLSGFSRRADYPGRTRFEEGPGRR
jgi:GTPase SAR1 family protein